MAIAAVLARLARRPDRLPIAPRHRAQHARMPGGIGGTPWASPQWRQLCMALGSVGMGALWWGFVLGSVVRWMRCRHQADKRIAGFRVHLLVAGDDGQPARFGDDEERDRLIAIVVAE